MQKRLKAKLYNLNTKQNLVLVSFHVDKLSLCYLLQPPEAQLGARGPRTPLIRP